MRRFHTFILQVQASRRECVSSAAFLCYRASVKEKVEGTERENGRRERMGGPWFRSAAGQGRAGVGVGVCVLLLPDSAQGNMRSNSGK